MIAAIDEARHGGFPDSAAVDPARRAPPGSPRSSRSSDRHRGRRQRSSPANGTPIASVIIRCSPPSCGGLQGHGRPSHPASRPHQGAVDQGTPPVDPVGAVPLDRQQLRRISDRLSKPMSCSVVFVCCGYTARDGSSSTSAGIPAECGHRVRSNSTTGSAARSTRIGIRPDGQPLPGRCAGGPGRRRGRSRPV
jgi:hypothetical protein